MKYLIVQEWMNTKGNHAGMKHMCDLLVEKYPDKYEMVVNPPPSDVKRSRFWLMRKIQSKRMYWESQYITPLRYKKLCSSIFKKLKPGDEVFLLEYCFLAIPQLPLAQYIKRKHKGVRVYGLSHLTPSFQYGGGDTYAQIIHNWSSSCDKMLTLGSSLSSFMCKEGRVIGDKVSTGFHYVDLSYYNNPNLRAPGNRLRVIAIGMLQRDFSLLASIVKATPGVDWVICKGHKNVDSFFAESNNVQLRGFMEEEELREEMALSDVSINVFDDTVGSNVITTSMAMGLAMVCSDVGSIRDYCTSENCVFCSNTKEDFVNAINKMAGNKEGVYQMKLKSLELSQRLSIDKVDAWFSSLNDN